MKLLTNAKLITALALSLLIPLALVPLADYVAIAPSGTTRLLSLAHGSLALICLAAVPTIVISLFFLVSARHRRTALLVVICAATYVVGFIGGVRIGSRIRASAFEQLAERSKPLIQAIDGYQRKYGQPPSSLDKLVPEFLPVIPLTGMAAYPSYKYVTGEESIRLHYENPWALYVSTPSGGINFDLFLYLPRHNYPEKGYGGVLRPIGDWAYVHE